MVKCGKAKKEIGFDIAKNQVEFANQKGGKLNIACEFVEKNIYEIKDEYEAVFDVVIITIGALVSVQLFETFRFF